MRDADPTKKALQEAIDIVGGMTKMAAALNMSLQRVNNWMIPGRRIPAEVCPDIERVTAEAGNRIRCERLRPDINWGVLRRIK